MSIYKPDVAGIFQKVADLLEIEGVNRFRIGGYWGAAQTVGGYSRTPTSARG